MIRPSVCSIRSEYTGKRTGVPQPTFQVMCDWSMTSVPESSSRTLLTAPISAQRLPHRDERRAALLLELGDPLRGVVEEPLPGFDSEPALVAQVGGRLRDAGLVGEVGVEEACDGGVDVEAGHVEQLDRRDHGELVADPPLDGEVEP